MEYKEFGEEILKYCKEIDIVITEKEIKNL